MSRYLYTLLVTVLFVSAGCDGNSNPTGSIRDTIWVIDSSELEPRHLVGRVRLMDICDTADNHGGVVVKFELTGQTTTTDDSGYYEFRDVGKLPTENTPIVSFTKEGYHTAVYHQSGMSYKVDSNQYVRNTNLYKHYNYSARFEGPMSIDSVRYDVFGDTVFTDANGVIVRKRIKVGTHSEYTYTFSGIALNENDQPTALATVYVILSKNRNYDHLNGSETAMIVGPQMRDFTRYPTTIPVYSQSFPYYGLKRGDTVHAFVTSLHECVSEYFVPGLRKSEPITFVLR